MEVRLANSDLILRRCIFVRLAELTIEKFQSLINNGAGAVVVLLPSEFQTSPIENREVMPFYFELHNLSSLLVL